MNETKKSVEIEEREVKVKTGGLLSGLVDRAKHIPKNVFPDGDKLAIINELWDKQTLQGLLKGEIVIAEETINRQLNKGAAANSSNSMALTLHQDGTIEIRAKNEKVGTILLRGEIAEAIHNKNESRCRYSVHSKTIENKPLLSWCFSLFTVSIWSRLFGQLDLGEGIKTSVTGNEVSIEFKEWLEQSKAGQMKVGSIRLLDAIEVQNIQVQEKALKVKVQPNANPLLLQLLRTQI